MAKKEAATCPDCQLNYTMKIGFNRHGKQNYRCQNKHCKQKSFLLNYKNKGCLPAVKRQVLQMIANGMSISETARTLGISRNTILSELNKEKEN